MCDGKGAEFIAKAEGLTRPLPQDNFTLVGRSREKAPSTAPIASSIRQEDISAAKGPGGAAFTAVTSTELPGLTSGYPSLQTGDKHLWRYVICQGAWLSRPSRC